MIIARKHNFSLMWLKGRVRVNDTEAGASKVKITLILADGLSEIKKKILCFIFEYLVQYEILRYAFC